MGLYADLQKDVRDAFNGDLADAVVTGVLYFKSPSDGSYDPATGNFVEDVKHYFPTTVNLVPKTDGTVRGVLMDSGNRDKEENLKFSYAMKKLMLLDSEINSHDFDFDNRKYYFEADDVAYEVVRQMVDPASASHTLMLDEVQ